ncbi:MAG: hypothetical protein FWE91_04565 [Defluviitaleaceae bacterium]|nr:hypothetical protein [Defluviitaleaceae bacterium]
MHEINTYEKPLIHKILMATLLYLSIISAIVQLSWFPIFINIFGNKLNLVDDIGFTGLGIRLSVILYSLSAITLIINILFLRGNNEKQKDFSGVLYTRFCFLLDKQNDQFNSIEINKEYIPAFKITYSNAEAIFVEWQKAICKFATIDENNISIRIIYRKFIKGEYTVWEDCNYKTKKQLSVEELMENQFSFGSVLQKSTSSFLYHNDKKKAVKSGEYFQNERDIEDIKDKKPLGSIFGFKHNLTDNNGKNLIEILVFFSTFREKLCMKNNRVGINNVKLCIQKIFLPQFELNIKAFLIRNLQKLEN